MTSRSELNRDALLSTLAWATTAAGTAFGMRFFIPIPGIDIGPLTLITTTMTRRLAARYGYDSLSGLAVFVGVVVGAASGAKLAAEVLTLVPGLGAGANAAATFSLHAITGVVLILVFNMLKDGAITESFIKRSPIGAISELVGLATTIVACVVRGGDGNDAIKEAIRKFKRRFP